MKTTPEILMVDDNPADIDLTSEVLAQSKGHFHVNAVNDGVEAISFLRRQGKYAERRVPDLVVLDLNLPRKDGCEVLSNIKADPALAQDSGRHFHHLSGGLRHCPQLQTGSELLSAEAGKSSGIRRGGAIHGGVLAGLCQPAAEGETMNDQSTHVLLIEDNPGDADLVRLRLVEGKSAVDVSCVNRLSDGLDSLKQSLPSVILLDLNLPDSQGAETFRKVLEKAPNVPVVILSGQDDEALAMKALHQGVQDYLVKGAISSSGLDRAMRYAVERQALLRSLEMSRKQQLEFKNQFLSHVSHELRTPLTCIHQFVTILLDGLAGEVSPEQRDHLKTILKSVNQLGAMVRDLLEASRAESGKIRIEPRCVAIGDLIRQAVAMMQPVAHEREVGLEVGVDTRIPFVHGDPGAHSRGADQSHREWHQVHAPGWGGHGASLPGADRSATSCTSR